MVLCPRSATDNIQHLQRSVGERERSREIQAIIAAAARSADAVGEVERIAVAAAVEVDAKRSRSIDAVVVAGEPHSPEPSECDRIDSRAAISRGQRCTAEVDAVVIDAAIVTVETSASPIQQNDATSPGSNCAADIDAIFTAGGAERAGDDVDLIGRAAS